MINVYLLYKAYKDIVTVAALDSDLKKVAASLLATCTFDMLKEVAESIGIDPNAKYTSIGSLCSEISKSDNIFYAKLADALYHYVEDFRLWENKYTDYRDIDMNSMNEVSVLVQSMWKEKTSTSFESIVGAVSGVKDLISKDVSVSTFLCRMNYVSFASTLKEFISAYLLVNGLDLRNSNTEDLIHELCNVISVHSSERVRLLDKYIHSNRDWVVSLRQVPEMFGICTWLIEKIYCVL